MRARGCLGFFMLIPLFIVFILAGMAVIIPLLLSIAWTSTLIEKKGRCRLLAAIVSLVIGGICVRLGYWYAMETSIEPITSFLYSEVDFPLIDWIFPFVLPILGWVGMIGGGLVIIVGTFKAIFVPPEANN